MKRYEKVFIMSLLSMFALTIPVFAREMTPQELGTKAKEQIPKTSYLYVIGEYAFTSEHTLTTQDVMLAARSIDAKDKNGKTQDDNIYKEMTIFQVKGEYDDLGDFTGNWKKGNNVVGTSQLGDNLNIRYIDYNYIKDIYTVTLDTDGGNQYKDPITVEEDGKIDQSLITGKNAPTKAGKQFKEWVLVKEDNQEEKWDFNKEVTGNMTLKATWYNEVNTDELLKEAQSKIQKNEFYGANFENRVLTYQIYDKNKKNSEIKDTGLVGTIRDILKNENVKLLTVTYDNSRYDFDSAEMNDTESEAYTKLKQLLTKVAGKNNFEEIIQGDLVGKELTLTINLNENIACSQNNKSEEEYTIKFTYEEQATIGAEIPKKDQDELKSKFNYTPENTYEVKGQDGLYTVSGHVTEQKNIEGFGENVSGFYFAYTITLNKGVDPTKAKAKIPKSDKTEDGYNEATFDIATNTLTVLMEVKEDENVKYRDIIVEVDGAPTKIRINFKELTFIHVHKVSFKGIEADEFTVLDGDTITEDMLPKNIQASDAYHEFVYWNKEDGTKIENITIDENTEDIILVPHWNLNSDKFIADVIADLKSSDTTYSQDFTNKFDLIVNNNSEITIDVKNPDTLLSEMNSTSIPGTIAYALNKDEIQEISLQVVDDTEDYTTTFNKNGVKTENDISMASEVEPEVLALKEKIQKGAKDLFTKVLQDNSKNEANMTLGEMATGENPSFKIKIEAIGETVTLVGNNGKAPIKEYTFTFKSDVVTVKDETALKQALEKQGVKTIYIGKDFNVTSSIEITNGDVTIIGGGHTLTAENQTSVFTVKSKNVAINNLTISSQKEGIIVESEGELKSKDLTVTACTEAGITVKLGGTLTGEKFTRENEKYDYPLVRAEKPQGGKKANINIKDSQGKEATATTIEIVEKYNNEEEQQGNAIGDQKQEKPNYNYVHYFNQSDIAKRWIKIVYIGDRAITHYPMTFTRYYDKEGTQTPNDIEPPENINYLTIHTNSLATFTVANWVNGKESYKKGNVPAPSSDTYYSAELTAEYKETTKEVKSEKDLIDAVKQDSSYSVVIIKQEITLNSVLDIQKEGLMITGAEAGTTEIKGTIKGQIKVSANDVTFDHINIIGKKVKDSEEPYNVVTINGDDFYSNGVKYSAESLGENNEYWNSILHYNGKDPTTIVYFGNFKGTNVEKMIEFVNEIDGKTRIIGNNFEGANETKEFILIDKLKEDAKVEIRQQTATFVGQNEYGIRVEAPAKATKATISLGEFWKKDTDKDVLKIAIDVTDTEYDASGYTFEAGNVFKDKIKIVYVKDGKESDNNPQGNEYNAKLMIGGTLVANPTVPEAATIAGLKLNGDTYSGILNQSEDGRFYLPVTLTSNDFQDNVSTVKVTNPNGEENTYTYSLSSNNGIATVSNANTMKLQLEAIKSSKITGNNGKVYKLELDADGANSDEYKVKKYTINYGDVETLEEIINEAAKNTQDANSLTIAKNNNIKGRKEEFNYQYDKSKNLTYYQSTDRLEEQYSFKVNSVIPSHKGPIIISVNKKSENYVAPENARPELNDWIFANFLSTVSMGSHEISLLQDMKKETTPIQAIEEVKPVEGKDHTYEVILNKERLNAWLDNAYLDTTKTEKEEASSQEDSNTVKLEIVLDTDEKYVVSIKTIENFSITTTSGLTYKNNKIDVQFSNIGTTEIQEPAKFLAKDGQELKEEDFKNYYEACKKWHKKETGADIYEGE